MSYVRYIDRTKAYYKAEGYEKPYQWAKFDEVPFLVKVGVEGDGLRARPVGRNDRLHAGFVDMITEPVLVIGFVGQQMFARQAFHQTLGLGDVVPLPRRQDEAQRIAQGIDGDVDLAAQPAARTSDGLILSPPFAPAAC